MLQGNPVGAGWAKRLAADGSEVGARKQKPPGESQGAFFIEGVDRDQLERQRGREGLGRTGVDSIAETIVGCDNGL